MIKIQRANNGWIVRQELEDEPEEIYVFDEGDSDKTAAHAFSSVLYLIRNMCGPNESRYSAHRIYITVAPGDKHSSHPDNQEEEEHGED